MTADSPRLGVRDTLRLAFFGAMLAAAAHVAYVYVRLHLLDRFTNTGREFPWMSPVAYLACLLVLAIPLAILARVVRPLGSPVVQGAVLLGTAVMGILLNATMVHPAALAALSLGAGVQAGRWLAGNLSKRLTFVWRAGLALAAAMFVVGIPEIVLYRWRQSSQVASLPAAREGAPNVILLILDTVRAANLSVYGYERPTTPVMQRIASEGTVFDAAITTAPWTAPSHASMLTGRYPLHTGISYLGPLSDSVPTITTHFRANGYATGAFMGNAGYGGRQTGFDRDFIRYDDNPVSLRQLYYYTTYTQLDIAKRLEDVAPTRRWPPMRQAWRRGQFRLMGVRRLDHYRANEIVDRFLSWRDEVGPRPYFAMMNFIDSHDPYISPMSRRFNNGRREIDQYDGAIAFSDSIIGHLMDALRARGELDRTVLVITADHGEHFGEHDLSRHGNSLYLELLHVPLLVRYPPAVPASVRVSAPVSTRDVPATLLDLSGLGTPAIIGHSLAHAWRPAADSAATLSPAIAEVERPINMSNRWPTSYGPMQALVRDSVHYIRRGDGLEQLFAWRGDTTGHGDQSSAPGADGVRADSRAVLRRELGPWWRSRRIGEGDTLSPAAPPPEPPAPPVATGRAPGSP